jgi:hypothetical protein
LPSASAVAARVDATVEFDLGATRRLLLGIDDLQRDRKRARGRGHFARGRFLLRPGRRRLARGVRPVLARAPRPSALAVRDQHERDERRHDEDRGRDREMQGFHRTAPTGTH